MLVKTVQVHISSLALNEVRDYAYLMLLEIRKSLAAIN